MKRSNPGKMIFMIDEIKIETSRSLLGFSYTLTFATLAPIFSYLVVKSAFFLVYSYDFPLFLS